MSIARAAQAVGDPMGQKDDDERERILSGRVRSMNDTSVDEDTAGIACPSCGAENIEQLRATKPVYQCRVCSAKFRPSGAIVEE